MVVCNFLFIKTTFSCHAWRRKNNHKIKLHAMPNPYQVNKNLIHNPSPKTLIHFTCSSWIKLWFLLRSLLLSEVVQVCWLSSNRADGRTRSDKFRFPQCTNETSLYLECYLTSFLSRQSCPEWWRKCNHTLKHDLSSTDRNHSGCRVMICLQSRSLTPSTITFKSKGERARK